MVAVLRWKTVGFGSLNPTQELNIVIPSVALLTIGSQGALASAFLSVLDIRRRSVATGGTGELEATLAPAELETETS